jgi:hypothetical protein
MARSTSSRPADLIDDVTRYLILVIVSLPQFGLSK